MPSNFFSCNTNRKKRPDNCLIQSCRRLISKGKLSEAISSLDLLAQKGIRLPSETLAFLLQQCAKTKALKLGKWVHLHLKLTKRKTLTTLLANHLINLYFKCGCDVDARKVFVNMPVKNLYSYNNMLSGYANSGMMKPARSLFEKMPERDVVSWNTMIIGYAHSGDFDEGLRFYKELRRLSIGYSEFSFAAILTICVKMDDLKLTRQVHGQVLVAGFLSNLVISSSVLDAYAKFGGMCDARGMFNEMKVRDVLAWTALVSGYAKWGDMETARKLFNEMPGKNPVSWTSLISGYARNGLGHKALELFTRMMVLRIRPDQFTFSSCLCACASIASLKHGKQIHGCLIRTNFRPNTIVTSSLIDMYSRCGSLEVGKRVFDLTHNKQDLVLWNTMISALAQHGYDEEVIQTFHDMVRSNVKPDRITFVIILNAFSRSGLVQEGLTYFEATTCDHGIVPDQEYYAYLIDCLGQDGCYNLIDLEPQFAAAYLLLSSIYTSLGKGELVGKVRQLMNEKQEQKEQAISWIEIKKKVHAFTVTDMLHPMKDVIYSVLDQLASQMEES